jgi:hypothetical protein
VSAPPVADETGVRVCSDLCSTCIFRPGNLMGLKPGRLKGMIEETLATDGQITCHKTLDQPQGAICRGWFDRYADRNWLLRLAIATDNINEVETS